MSARTQRLQAAFEARLLAQMLRLTPRLQRLLAGRPVIIEGQRLATESQLMLRLMKAGPDKPVEELSIPKGRVVIDKQAVAAGGTQPIGAIRDFTLPGPAGDLRTRLYLRTGSRNPEPLLVFFHGGGWIYGGLDSHDATCRLLAERAGVRVLSIDYRLAPEARFPAAYDDTLAALRWSVDHAAELGADPDRIAVGGDSAGGALAAAVAIQAACDGIALKAQLLVYPATDMTASAASRRTFAHGFFLTKGFMDLASESYLDPEQRRDPRASVLEADIPAGLAPAYVITAGFDPLRDEGEAYAKKLREAGVDVRLQRFPDMIHGFFNVVGVGRTTPQHVREIAATFRQMMR